MAATNVRFIERDYFKSIMVSGSEFITDEQIDKILDIADCYWADLTFKFFDNGTLIVIDNDTDLEIPLKELRGACYDFYVRERIQRIRTSLQEKILQSA
jgi:hypothetical protein